MPHLPNDPLVGLNEQQREVVRSTQGPVLVLAGAGSGKTKALTHRIAYLVQQRIARVSEILAVTFTNKAAAEMKQRVVKLLGGYGHVPSSIGTFHGLGAQMLREQAQWTSRSSSFVIFDRGDSERLVRQAMSESGISTREYSPRLLLYHVSDAKNAGRRPADLEESGEAVVREAARVWNRYEQLLAANDGFDFDDLILEPVRLLAGNLRIRAAYQARWQYLLVDEYQDTNPLQDSWLKLLLGPERNLCAVGDDYQAIYSWRGARVDHILQFEKEFLGCKVIYLTQNYRSTPPILEAANRIIAENHDQKHKELWTAKKRGEALLLVTVPSDRYEARWICQQIQAHVTRGGRLRDCLILYRTNAQSRLFEEEFLRERLPYTIVGGFRFYERREIKDAIALLQLSVNPNATLSLRRLADCLLPGVGPKTIERWEREAVSRGQTLREVLTEEGKRRAALGQLTRAYQVIENKGIATVSDILRILLKESGYLKWVERQADGEERRENIEELLNVTAAYREVSVFLEEVALLTDIDTLAQRQDRITCMTLHSAKGLEWPVVWVVGLEEGLLPHRNSFDSRAQLEEERRLLYVGMTRAQHKLVLTQASSRMRQGQFTVQVPSRFLTALPRDVETMDLTEEIESSIGSDAESYQVVADSEFVTHPTFGQGVVIGKSGSTITCVFEGFGVKTVDAAEGSAE